MKQLLPLFSVFLLLSTSTKSFAWGEKGHSIVPEITFKYLDENTKQVVLAYFNGMSIESAANWMDEMRSEPSYNYMKSWHFLDLEKGETFQPSTEANILSKLGDVIKQLHNAKRMKPEDVNQALLVLFHLIGDLHQPLHVGYGNDAGGNAIDVLFLGNKTNLHKVWDSEIITYKNISTTDCVAWYNGFTTEELSDYKQVNILKWFEQTRTLMPSVYGFKDSIDAAYIHVAVPIIEKQLLIAGIRLASVLTEVFGSLKPENAAKDKPVVTTKDGKTLIPVDEVALYEGKLVTVCTKVFGTKYLDKSNGTPTLLNLGANFPNSPLTVMIWGNDRKHFKNAPEEFYKGKEVCVTGKVVMYKGKPEIIITKESEIVVQ